MGHTLPIKNQMNSVFVHVTNLKVSAKWYSDLLGLPVDIDKVVSPVFNVPLDGSTSLTLDDHIYDPNFTHMDSPNPIFNLYAPDIEEAYQYIVDKRIEIVREIERVDDTAWFNITDPDGNVVMVCNC